MEMFVKRDEKNTLEDTFKEAIKVKKGYVKSKGNLGAESHKDKSNTKIKVTSTKPSEDTKDQDSLDMESLQRIIKKLSNDIIDIKRM
jgi:hypothetical protein